MLFETFVVMEIVKQNTWSTAPAQLFHVRDTEQREVNLVLDSPAGDVAGIEIKSATSLGTRSARGLRFLRDKLGERFRAGAVIYQGEHTLPLDDRIWALPVSGLWKASR